MPTHLGGCHCGAVRFEVTGEIDEAVICNCSICAKTGYLHWEVDPAAFRLLTPEAPIRNYQFGTRTSKNLFCEHCGISAFRRSRSSPDTVDVNVRCLEGVDVEALPVTRFDGRSGTSDRI
jgi:hypothetical protein